MGLDDVIGDVWASRVRRGRDVKKKSDDKGKLVTARQEKKRRREVGKSIVLGREEITIHDCVCGCRDTAERGRVDGNRQTGEKCRGRCCGKAQPGRWRSEWANERARPVTGWVHYKYVLSLPFPFFRPQFDSTARPAAPLSHQRQGQPRSSLACHSY
jgi:hypothetical protein